MTDIKFCENNFSFGTDEVMRKLKESHRNIEVSADSCLGYCGDCEQGPFALVNDEMIQADTEEELFDMIENMLE
ncbi:DUF1450 domain-containing protein [Clostridium oryzae]|uniref:DUF1450 domain-containing protein n=1 Tax=Clostridium oryzae TaxID=1450648 RepID=A0A1V4IW14_9CLOT|nr:DUF1450 domain-containing protein [Clostridium oryzae]OPJ63974.1 hypothetical protein CLORY_08460 [Clostridium oryzae]